MTLETHHCSLVVIFVLSLTMIIVQYAFLFNTYMAISIAVIPQQLSISQSIFNHSLRSPLLNGTDPKFTLTGRFGSDSLPVISTLMDAVSGLADLAHLPFKERIRGFHVPNLPHYTDIDISIQPAAPATDFEVRFAIWGIYYILYAMVKGKSFKDANFNLLFNNEEVVHLSINNRVVPSAIEANQNHLVQGFTNDVRSLSGKTTTKVNATSDLVNTGFQHFFEYLHSSDDESINAQTVFITTMATLMDLAAWPDTDIVKPFRCGASGFDARIQFLELESPRTEPPFLHYGYLIDTVKQIPAFSLSNKKFAEMMITMSFGSDIIGEAILEKDTPEPSSSEAAQA